MIERLSSTGSGAIAFEKSPNIAARLLEVRLTLGAAVADLDDLTVSIDSELGAAFDTVLATPDADEDLTAVTSWRYADQVPPVIFPGDVLKVTWPNAGEKTWGIEIIWSK